MSYSFAKLEDFEHAINAFEEALVIHGELGDRSREANDLDNIGTLSAVIGNTRRAEDSWKAALRIFVEIGDPKSAEVQQRLYALRFMR